MVVTVPDPSRNCPVATLLPPVLERLTRAGLRDEQITVAVGCGLHRTTTAAEKRTLWATRSVPGCASSTPRA